ncbi:MAG TPA: ABC transporter permease [Acidobacteriota bacterium]|nr:ABC transporter permease [Acidobacteriota bacterium]
MTRHGASPRLARLLAVLLATIALFGDFLSVNPPQTQNLDRFYGPPSRIHFFDSQGRFHWRPFLYEYELVNPLDVVYRERTDKAYPLEFMIQGYRYRFMGLLPTTRHLVGCREAMHFYPLGADELGRDVLARLLAGARISLLVVFLGLALYALLGVTIGMLSGLAGGWPDSLLMRFSEFVLALPALYLILALRALLPAKMAFWQTLVLTIGTIASVTWPPMARGVRGLILQLRHSAYVEAARALGSSNWQIMKRHMLPALAPFALSQAAVAAPVFLLGEVVLSYLDVGFNDTAGSWGVMLRNLKEPRIFTDFWWNMAPLGMVFVTLYCLNAFGAGGREIDLDSRIVRL